MTALNLSPQGAGYIFASTTAARVALLIVLAVQFSQKIQRIDAYRTVGVDEQIPFQFTDKGFVGRYGDPLTAYQQDRINEGAPQTTDYSRLWDTEMRLQSCPDMIGPVASGMFYCGGPEYGYCDRRTGTCMCNRGYQGPSCQDCTPTHYEEGSLCYPKRPCPNDCSGGGTCSYRTGTCQCTPFFVGDDCSIPTCRALDPYCEDCSGDTCTRCEPGFFVKCQGNACACVKCSDTYDPRCTVCDDRRCLQCGDLLLTSVRRSGRRKRDPVLPPDELKRQLSYDLPFPTQSDKAFDEAEPYVVVPQTVCLNATSKSCVQGLREDDSWQCFSPPIGITVSHCVCGSAGTVHFSSPQYRVREDARYVNITLRRTGGGYGHLALNYSITHLDTTGSDVALTPPYTSSQRLVFDAGVVELIFKVQIVDDRDYEPSKRFLIALTQPSSGTLGNTNKAIVVIDDDDGPLAVAKNCVISGAPNDQLGQFAAGLTRTLTILTFNGLGAPFTTTSQSTFVSKLYAPAEYRSERAVPGTTYRRVATAWTQSTDNSDGTYSVPVTVPKSGSWQMAVWLAVPGGLLGRYYDSGHFLGSPTVSRVDPAVNFTWGLGRLTPQSRDLVTIRWTGTLLTRTQDTYTFYLRAASHVRLSIGNNLIIDSWDRDCADCSGKIYLQASKHYEIQLDYRHVTNAAWVYLEWSTSTWSREVISSRFLCYLKHIRGSPFNITARSDASDPAKTLVSGKALSAATSGQPSSIFVFPRDTQKNPRGENASSDVITASLTLTRDDGSGIGPRQVSGNVVWDLFEKRFEVEYTITVTGLWSMAVLLNSQPIKGSSFLITASPSDLFAAYCTASGTGLVSAIVGRQATFTIQARDGQSNTRPSGDDVFDVTIITSVEGKIAQSATVVHQQNGLYLATYTPIGKGTNYISIKVGDSHLPNSPYSVSVTSLDVTAGMSSASPVKTVTAGVQTSFEFVARDLEGNEVDSIAQPGQSLQLSMDNGATVPVSVLIRGARTVVSYTPLLAGPQLLRLKVNSVEIFDSPFSIEVLPGSPNAATSTVTGVGLMRAVAGTTANLTVQAVDANLNPLIAGGDQFTATLLSGSTSVAVTFQDRLDGTYVGTYTATMAGTYSLSILQNVQHVIGSPYQVVVEPAVMDPRRSFLEGSGVVSGTAGVLSSLRVHSLDRYGNPCIHGGDWVEIALEGPSLIIPAVTDQQSGIYDASYLTPTSGNYTINAQHAIPGGLNATYFNTRDLSDPVLFRVDPQINFDWGSFSPDPAVAHDFFSVLWEGFILPEHDEDYIFMMRGNYGFKIIVDGKVVVDNWEGTHDRAQGKVYLYAKRMTAFRVEFWHKTDEASVSLFWKSQSTPETVIPSQYFYRKIPIGSILPKTPQIFPAAPNPPTSTAAGSGLQNGRSGVLSTFTVISRDAFGNRQLRGGDLITAVGRAAQGTIEDVALVADNKDGSYTVSFTPTDAGVYQIYVLLNSGWPSADIGRASSLAIIQPFLIQDSPFAIDVRPNVATPNSIAMGTGLVTAVAGEVARFTVEAKDLNFNTLRDDSTIYSGALTGSASFPISFTYMDNGRYEGSYNATKTGTFTLSVSIGGQAISGMPKTVLVSPALARAGTTFVSGFSPIATSGALNTFTVDVRDRFGNSVEREGHAILVSFSGPEFFLGVVTSQGDGRYVVQYKPSRLGSYQLDILLGESVATEGANGLRAEYYDNIYLAGTPLLTRVDTSIDFDWAAYQGSPIIPGSVDRISVRWSGFLRMTSSTNYVFTVNTADSVRLWIDSKLALDSKGTVDQVIIGAGYKSLPLWLNSGAHQIVVEYAEGSGRAISLWWTLALGPTTKVPSTVLSPTANPIRGSPLSLTAV